MTWNTNTSILAQLETFSAETAWTNLAEHFRPVLTRYAQRAGVPAEAHADVVQETLIAFAESYRRGTYDRTRGRLSGWLFGIARREVARSRRRAALDPAVPLDAAEARELNEHGDALEAIWEEEWRRAILERCIERVRKEVEPATWECFELHIFQGLSVDEVAARMGMPPTRVYNAKHRVSRRLRELVPEFEDA